MAEVGDGAEAQLKKLHPFFSGPNAISKASDAVTPPTPDSSCGLPSDESKNDPIENDSGYGEPRERKRKRRKTDPSSHTPGTLPRVIRPKCQARLSAGPSIIEHFVQGVPNDGQPVGERMQDDGRVREPTTGGAGPYSAQTCESIDNTSSTMREEGRQPASGQKPQKLLKFNPATGTIGPPPPAKQSTAASTPVSGKKRGRKPKTMVVTVLYGSDVLSRENIGQKINAVLSGTDRVSSYISMNSATNASSSSHETQHDGSSRATKPKENIPQRPVLPKKPAHPFFQAKGKAAPLTNGNKPKAKMDKVSPQRQVIFSSTPCSPKRTRPTPPNSSFPISSSKTGGVKIPGAQHPAWPWHDMVHVRDSSHLHLDNNTGDRPVPDTFRRRKAKGQAVHISGHENILSGNISKLCIRQLADDLKSINDESFRPIAPLLRVPIKHFESGRKLHARIFGELRTLKNNSALLKTHPAIAHGWESIATALSAFDTSTCESVAWAQKYAPTSARCVLQSGREAELLRDWLQTLKVQAVDTGTSDSAIKPKNASVTKKKRRHKKLEGFVVSSDEEANDMDEISDDGADWYLSAGRGDTKKTVVRSGDLSDRGSKASGRLTNAVLLSGPHGCGKTATVYAIAKELDFEIFEINAGARRSGKDILERVGDMTRNHLVHHQQKDDAQRDDTTGDDLKSGKQGMMTSFFKPKLSQSTKGASNPEQTSKAPPPPSQDKKLNRDQKQSLILLEEVDILYEEDKQFWATVISMIAQSKRPFIMTCNNESVVPLQSLKLHGIFRLSTPPTDLAVDMLLLIAANEGHALGRRAVETLYESRGHDLRATITELNYWCQIGVGDLRGGFDWFYPRWPKGSDVDQDGHTIRVVSQDTYHTGMGWLNRDLTSAESSLPLVVPYLHREAWEHWGVDISDHHEFEDCSSWPKNTTEQFSSRASGLALLQSIEAFTDSMSDSDICGPFLPHLSNHIALDPTVPNLHAKTLDDFTIGNKVLEVASLHHYNSISLDMSTSLKLLGQSNLAERTLSSQDPHAIERFDEKRVTGDIEHHIKTSLQTDDSITRKDYSVAFDPIAASDKIMANGYLDPSVFDREMKLLCVDVAPYVRSIVAYDQRLHNERRSRSNLLSEGGEPEKKRMRTTRAALSALEGGSRATIRRERYFAADINPYLVMRTGGESWDDVAQQAEKLEKQESVTQERDDITMDTT